MSAETVIKTFVFFDLEATGLERPRITELCLLSVQREELQTRNGLPRVVNKLTLCVDPRKPIDPYASQITGLYNDSLESQSTFDQSVVEMVAMFFSRLPQPVCLIAHYGNGFDFKLLNAELQKTESDVPVDILCVDSLEAFKSLDMQEINEAELTRVQNQNNTTPTGQGTSSEDSGREMQFKRKADQDQVDAARVKKRLFSDGDKTFQNQNENTGKQSPSGQNYSTSELVSESGEDCDKAEKHLMLNVAAKLSELEKNNSCNKDSNLDVSGGMTPVFEPVQDNQHEQINDRLQTLDSQHSVTDDILMEAADFVEGKNKTENSTVCTSSIVAAGNMCKRIILCPVNQQNSDHKPTDDETVGRSGCIQGSLDLESSQPSHSSKSVTKCSSGVLADNVESLSDKPVQSAMNNNSVSSPSCTPIIPQTQVQATSKVTPRLSYKLENIYLRTFGTKPPVSHTAEDDCVTLLKVIKKRCPQFIEWADKQAIPLSKVSPF